MRTVAVMKRLSNCRVNPSTNIITRDRMTRKPNVPNERVNSEAKNTARLPPRKHNKSQEGRHLHNLPSVLSPTHFGFETPDCERLLPTIAPRGSAKKTGLMISE